VKKGTRPPLLIPTVVAFCLGAGLMLPFEYTITRLLGVISFAAFFVLGMLLVANPDFLERDGSED
jgi:hypothetical protein